MVASFSRLWLYFLITEHCCGIVCRSILHEPDSGSCCVRSIWIIHCRRLNCVHKQWLSRIPNYNKVALARSNFVLFNLITAASDLLLPQLNYLYTLDNLIAQWRDLQRTELSSSDRSSSWKSSFPSDNRQRGTGAEEWCSQMFSRDGLPKHKRSLDETN